MREFVVLMQMIGLGLVLLASGGAAQPHPQARASAEGILFSESFEDADLASRGWYDGASFRIVGEAMAGKGCIEYEWPDRQSDVKGSSPVRHLFEPTDEVSIRFYLKLSKGWGWSGQNFHPHLTHFLTTENPKWHSPAASHLTLYIEPVGGKLRLAAQDIQNKDRPHGLTQGPLKGGYNGTFYDSQAALFKDDQWHCIEAYFRLNTLDLRNDRPNRDGIVRGWCDGKLVVEHTDVVLRSTDFPTMKFNQFLMAPYFGPGLLPHAQKLWIDELAVGTKRIGPLALPKNERKRTGKREKGQAGKRTGAILQSLTRPLAALLERRSPAVESAARPAAAHDHLAIASRASGGRAAPAARPACIRRRRRSPASSARRRPPGARS